MNIEISNEQIEKILPNDCTYEFGEVERVVITGSDSA